MFSPLYEPPITMTHPKNDDKHSIAVMAAFLLAVKRSYIGESSLFSPFRPLSPSISNGTSCVGTVAMISSAGPSHSSIARVGTCAKGSSSLVVIIDANDECCNSQALLVEKSLVMKNFLSLQITTTGTFPVIKELLRFAICDQTQFFQLEMSVGTVLVLAPVRHQCIDY